MANHDNYHSHSKVYRNTCIALMVLTVVTVVTAVHPAFHFPGSWNIIIALIIATAKASLVCLWFMHLKEDNRLNGTVFLSSLFCLALFIGLTATDQLQREVDVPVKVSERASGKQLTEGEFAKLKEPSPEQLANGKALFAQQCASCHGESGKGDGPAAAALNPAPRNFHAVDGWKNGRKMSQIFKTLQEGIPGGPMASYANLSFDKRFSLIHYIRSFMQEAPADEAGDLAIYNLQQGDVQAVVDTMPIPIEMAIERLSSEQ